MAFIDERFPEYVDVEAEFAEGFNVAQVRTQSGGRTSTALWTEPLAEFQISVSTRAVGDIETLYRFFAVAGGPENTFRFKNWFNYKSCSAIATPAFGDQNIGTGDDSTTQFQLRKSYTIDSSTRYKTITKPVSGSVLVGVNGVNQASGWTVDTSTGIITFSAAPPNGQAVTAGYEFDYEVYFEDQKFRITMNHTEISSAPSFILREHRA